MPYNYTSTMKSFVASCFLESLRSARPASRRALTTYTQGAQAVNNGNRYIAIQSGTTSAGTGPTAASGTQFDGTVQWLGLGTDAVKDGDITSNLYLAIGRQDEWSNPASPPVPDVSGVGETTTLEDITTFLLVNSDNVRLGISKNSWTSGTVYSQFDPQLSEVEYPTPNFVIVDDTYVYKCLDNNNGAASVDSPSGTGSGIIEKSDGYIWKFVGLISSKDLVDFGTSSYVPLPVNSNVTLVDGSISTFDDVISTSTPFGSSATIATRVVGNGSGASATVRTSTAGNQTTVTGMFASAGGSGYSDAFAIAYDAAAAGSGANLNLTLEDDSVSAITVSASGSSYNTATVIIIGDGSGAAATATVAAGAVTSVAVTNGGIGYTWARAFIIPGLSGSVARGVLAPAGGHGTSLTTELNASTALLSVRLTASLNNYIPTESDSVDGSFRQVSLVSGVRGTTRNAEAYLGPAHPSYSSPGNLDKYLDGSGFVVYINNIAAITHTPTQEEILKVSITL